MTNQCASCGGFCRAKCERESLDVGFVKQEIEPEKLRLEINDIDDRFACRLAFMLELMLWDATSNWNAAANLLDEYKAEWGKVNPTPPTFMGEPISDDRIRALKSKPKESTS